jgi:hypothetical protein
VRPNAVSNLNYQRALSTPCCQLWRHGAWFVYVNCFREWTVGARLEQSV